MRGECNRGNGFIVSPLSAPFSPKRLEKKPKTINTSKKIYIKDYAKDITSNISAEWKNVRSDIFKKIFSFVAVSGCIIFYSNFFTVGTAIYKGNKLIAYTYSDEDYSNAISSIEEYAAEHNIKDSDFRFRAAPAITFKNNIIKNNQLYEKLLSSSDSLSYGCTLYSENTAVFSVKNEQIAKEIISEYIASYSMGGEADIGVKLNYKTEVLPVSEISDKEECFALLTERNLPVISVVNQSHQKEIPFETKTEYDARMYIGETITVVEGKTGSALIEEETIYKNGKADSERVISENVTIQPVTQIVKTGTKPKDVLQSGLYYPLSGRLSSPFGARWGKMHEGIDIAVPIGTSVKAAESGTVIYAGNGGGYGNFIKIDHGNGVVTAYAHLDKIIVKKGQVVTSDTEIAKSGNTGRSTGPHLHFEVLKNEVPLDPSTYLKKR